jgi:uncharacterized protein (TIGR03435 family)
MFAKWTILCLSLLTAAVGQHGAVTPRYEVASIKSNTDSDVRMVFRIDANGNLTASAITLKRLMMTAYNVQGFRIVGGPRWIDSRRWDVRATHEGALSADESRLMLRTLLGDRFHLRTHDESRREPVYELVADRRPPRVPATKDPNAQPEVHVGSGLMDLSNATAATFASQLSYAVARPVLDRTQLLGRFDFHLEWTPEPGEDGGPTTAGAPATVNAPQPATSNGPSIFGALREQLGLRLNAGRGPVDVVVVDHVEVPAAD